MFNTSHSVFRALVYFGIVATVILLPSRLVAQDFYDIYSVKEIRINFEQDNWAEILAKLKDQGQKKRATASIKINGVTYDSVGVRYKGNSSYFSVKNSGYTKLPFNVKLNHKICLLYTSPSPRDS